MCGSMRREGFCVFLCLFVAMTLLGVGVPSVGLTRALADGTSALPGLTRTCGWALFFRQNHFWQNHYWVVWLGLCGFCHEKALESTKI